MATVLRTVAPILAWWGGAGAAVVVALMLHSPYLYSVRAWAGPALLVLGGAAVAVAGRRAMGRGLRAWWLAAVWCAVPLQVVVGAASLGVDRSAVLSAGPAARELGRRFIVGYDDAEAVRPLVEKGLVAGLFITRRNIAGRTAADLADEIAAFQRLRRAHGLPPLFVATDQEGGVVSRLSPPLTALPPLAALVRLAPAERRNAVSAYAAIHGRELADLGVTVDFAPVADLRPSGAPAFLDRLTRTASRAIAADPDTVGEVAATYAAGLERAGVTPVVKHFPGLARVSEDTHLVGASLEVAPAALEAADWRPFRRVLDETGAWLMLSHVTLTAVDPDRPVSQSRAVVQGLLRGEWGFRGVLVTDDMTMGGAYLRGTCTSTRDALDAGVDLLLFAYDWEQYFRAMACALDAAAEGAPPPS